MSDPLDIKIQEGESALEFIQRRGRELDAKKERGELNPFETAMKGSNNSRPVNVAVKEDKIEIVEPEKETEVSASSLEKQILDSLSLSDEVKTVEAPEPVVEEVELPEEEEVIPTDVDPKTAELSKNLSNQRKVLKTIKQQNKALQEELELKSQRVKEFEEGLVTPDIITNLKTENEQLTYYRDLHDFKMSDEYQEQVLNPIQDIDTSLAQKGAEYGLSNEILEKMIRNTNEADLNKILSSKVDPIGGLEIKNLIKERQRLTQQAHESLKKPKETLARLKEEARIIQEQKEIQRVNTLSNQTKIGWSEAIAHIKNENISPEIILKDGDKEFNDKVVLPRIRAASETFSRTMKELIKSGVKDVNPELIKQIAVQSLYAHAYTTAAMRANMAESELSEIRNNTKEYNQYIRPTIGGTVNRGMIKTPSNNGTPSDGLTAAQRAIKQVMKI